MWTIGWTGVLGFCVAVVTFCIGNDPCRGDTPADKVAQSKIVNALQAPTEMKFTNKPLATVVEYLKQAHLIDIRIDRPALAEACVSPDVSITARYARDMSLSSVLLITLRRVGLVCVVHDGSLLVTIPERAPKKGEVLPGLTMPKPPADFVHAPAAKKLIEALQKPTEFKCIEQPLNSVAKHFEEVLDFPIFIDHQALRKIYMPDDTPVTYRIPNGISVRSGLLLLLGQLGLTCARQDEFLVITTFENAAFWGGPIPAGDPTKDPHVKAAVKRIETALKSPTRLEFIETPLQDVTNYLGDLHSIPVVIDQRGLKKVGIGPDTPCTAEAGDLPLATALDLLFEEYRLAYEVKHEVLLITALPPDPHPKVPPIPRRSEPGA